MNRGRRNFKMERNRNVSELAHHGIKGQRWGRRRYQNEDGGLTPLGRIRYNRQQNPDERIASSPRFNSAKVHAHRKWTEEDGIIDNGLRIGPNVKSATFNRPNDVQDNVNNSPNVKSATFNRPNTNNSNSNQTNANNNNNQTNANDSNKPNTNTSNKTNANNGKKRLQDMTTEELRADNMHYAALNQYKKNHSIKSQGEIRKDISDQANKAVSSVKDIGNSINKIRSVDKPGPDYSHLSNAELQERINRINLEQRYADLTRPRESSKAVKFKETMNVIGGVVAFTGSVIGVANAIKDLRSSS